MLSCGCLVDFTTLTRHYRLYMENFTLCTLLVNWVFCWVPGFNSFDNLWQSSVIMSISLFRSKWWSLWISVFNVCFLNYLMSAIRSFLYCFLICVIEKAPGGDAKIDGSIIISQKFQCWVFLSFFFFFLIGKFLSLLGLEPGTFHKPSPSLYHLS